MCDIFLEKTDEPFKMYDYLSNYMISNTNLQRVFKIKDTFLIGKFARGYIFSHLAFGYEVITIYIICAREVIQLENIPLSSK
jgi:hypothetical protein